MPRLRRGDLLRQFPDPRHLLEERDSRRPGNKFLESAGGLFTFCDNLAKLVQHDMDLLPAAAVPALSSFRRASRVPLATEFAPGSGLGLSSSKKAPSETAGEDDHIVLDKKSEEATPEIVTQSAIMTLLTALCHEVAPNLEFTSEQHMYWVNTGRQGGGFVAKDDGGLDRLHDRKTERDRWVALECKPRFSGDDPCNTALGQHAAELYYLGLFRHELRLHGNRVHSMVCC